MASNSPSLPHKRTTKGKGRTDMAIQLPVARSETLREEKSGRSSLQDAKRFLLTEFCVFLTQLFIVFMLGFLFSDFFSRGDRLKDFVASRMNGNTMWEL